MKEHDEHCKYIADQLEKIASGGYTYYDGELEEIQVDDDGAEYLVIDGEIYSYYDELTIEGKTYTGAEINSLDDDIYPASMGDYFDEYYDVDYIVDYKKEYEHARIMVACGGPAIFINTWDRCVELFWWTESGKAYLTNDICDEIDAYFEEIYNCF